MTGNAPPPSLARPAGATECDLLSFAGRHGDRFLARRTGWRRVLDGLCPGALVFSFAWFYWRRMPVLGGLVFVPAALGSWAGVPIPGLSASVVLHLLGAASGRSLYRLSARRRARRADSLDMQGDVRAAYLHAAGGTSVLAGVLAGVVWLILTGGALEGLLTALWTSRH